jgi:hypothetical protein
LKAKVHSAKVMDYEGIKILLKGADEMFPGLSLICGWTAAIPWRGQGQGLGREDPGLERGSSGASPKARSQRSADGLGRGVGQREGVALDWKKLLPPQGFVVLPRRWVVEIV